MHASYFEELHATYQNQVQFLIVYITDAHSKDEWPIGKNTVSFCNQPKTLEERCVLAQKYKNDNELSVPMAVDRMTNDFDVVFSAWPVRFYVVKENKLVFKAQPDPEQYGYDFDCLGEWLEKNC